jgi:deoxycytidylate deaminase
VDGSLGMATARALDPGKFGPELVFAIVKPVGTPDDEFVRALEGDLVAYGYRLERIKLSGVLADFAEEEGRQVPLAHEEERIAFLMDEGDEQCRRLKDAATVALFGVNEIRSLRFKANSIDASISERDRTSIPLARTAYLLDSLKRPAEVLQLRRIYGDRLILVGLQASRRARMEHLEAAIRPQRPSALQDVISGYASALIERDLRETDEVGQNTLKAFPMADVFVDVEKDPVVQVRRLLKLLFGDTDYEVPTVAEYGMHLAKITSTRSAELGLKVGAAIVRDDSTVVALGVNAHPIPTGSPAYDASTVDIKELVVDTLNRLAPQLFNDAAAERLARDPDAMAAELLEGELGGSKVKDLTEFQPTVHAEMGALLDALRRGASLDDTTVYVTAFPCHNCAKHLVALKRSVIYLEPYPKSRATAMYGNEVEDSFAPFTGIAPRRYEQLFSVSEDRKRPNGSRIVWAQADREQAQPKVNEFIHWRGIAERESAALVGMLASLVTVGKDPITAGESPGTVVGRVQDEEVGASDSEEDRQVLPRPATAEPGGIGDEGSETEPEQGDRS